MKDKIAAALRKLGPSSPLAIANEIEIEPSLAGYHLRAMLEAKSVIAAGNRRTRLYSLPDQKLEGAPPQERKLAKRKKRGAGKKTPRAAPIARAAERFIPTVDVDLGLHIINGADPISFNASQTEAIATLLFNHYKA